MEIPSRQHCYQLIREMNMLDHIVRHSLQVCRVAMLLAERLEAGSRRLNLELVQAAALLHDITKTRSFSTGERHTDSGCALLTARGYPAVGEIVRQHVKLDIYFESDCPSEAEVVNYADKRVLHDRIVSMQERMQYILLRYGSTPEYCRRLQWLWEKSVEQEGRIFDRLHFGPAAVEKELGPMDLADELRQVLAPVTQQY